MRRPVVAGGAHTGPGQRAGRPAGDARRRPVGAGVHLGQSGQLRKCCEIIESVSHARARAERRAKARVLLWRRNAMPHERGGEATREPTNCCTSFGTMRVASARARALSYRTSAALRTRVCVCVCDFRWIGYWPDIGSARAHVKQNKRDVPEPNGGTVRERLSWRRMCHSSAARQNAAKSRHYIIIWRWTQTQTRARIAIDAVTVSIVVR